MQGRDIVVQRRLLRAYPNNLRNAIKAMCSLMLFLESCKGGTLMENTVFVDVPVVDQWHIPDDLWDITRFAAPRT